ncbi:MAG: polysaccharide deacetylase family protein [Bacteroidota bacterium]
MIINNTKSILILILFLFSISAKSQLQVAITVDDVPKGKIVSKEGYESKMLNTLNALKIPICIFINEGKLHKTDSIVEKTALLDNWSSQKYITLGNHSYSHFRYSEVGFDIFSDDIMKGEKITKELSKKYKKPLKYFRFPYNDLGKDSLQHKQIADFLKQKNYQITPFTIESIDWMYNSVYEYYMNQKDTVKAKAIGQNYVDKTLEYFTFFEELALKKYGRPIKQIYLCHDNNLNATYLPILIEKLKLRKYKFISLDKALKDKVYKQKDIYTKKWGISWMYRWMDKQEERTLWMKKEPHTEDIEKLYQSIQEQNK